ncbi:MAG: hypothetical protein RMH93_06855 [Aquificaceae bacterium]|nr:hypothetical protein [Aquificaceae bacterium]
MEDVRIEHLIRQKYGWVFSTWEYPEKELLEKVIDNAPLVAWLYTKKVASSRGEDVPEEYVELFRAKVGEEKLKELEKAYEEAISIRNSFEMKEFLERYTMEWEEDYAKLILGAGGGGHDLMRGGQDVLRIEEETSEFERELSAVLGCSGKDLEGSGEEGGKELPGFRGGRGEGGVRFSERYLEIKPNEHLKKYLSWLYAEEVRRVKSKDGGKLNIKEYVKWRARGSPSEENLALFTRLRKEESSPKIVLIVDTKVPKKARRKCVHPFSL